MHLNTEEQSYREIRSNLGDLDGVWIALELDEGCKLNLYLL